MKRTLFILALTLGIFACDDIFEKDLTDKTVTIIAPSDGIVVEPGEVTFVWRETEGAFSYHLRIVGGSFESGGYAVVDTLMHNDSLSVKRKCTIILQEGEYQWSIQARNGAYETKESIFTLFVTAPEQ